MENDKHIGGKCPDVSESSLTVWLCADCGKMMDLPFDSGDNKVRCETCAVAKYKRDNPLRNAVKKVQIIQISA